MPMSRWFCETWEWIASRPVPPADVRRVWEGEQRLERSQPATTLGNSTLKLGMNALLLHELVVALSVEFLDHKGWHQCVPDVMDSLVNVRSIKVEMCL